MPEKIRAVAFDLDGLMFNTEEVYEQSGTELLRRRGKTATREMFDRMMGRRAPEALAIMIETHDLPVSVEELIKESEAIFYEMLDDILRPMPGLFELLDQIERRALPKGVATSSSRPYLKDLLGRFALEHRFPITMTAEDVTRGKPHPEIYLTIADRFGVAPEEMLVLEDSEAGTRAAAAAGAYVISIPHRHCSGHDYSMAHAVARQLDDPLILELLP